MGSRRCVYCVHVCVAVFFSDTRLENALLRTSAHSAGRTKEPPCGPAKG